MLQCYDCLSALLHLVERGAAWGPAQSPPRCTKCNSPQTNGQLPITVLLYNGTLLFGFNVRIKGLTVLTTCLLTTLIQKRHCFKSVSPVYCLRCSICSCDAL